MKTELAYCRSVASIRTTPRREWNGKCERAVGNKEERLEWSNVHLTGASEREERNHRGDTLKR